jgi:hypothetical protein|tara:strand:- start:283 stop:630 length:348 start_codon:yes stop_codon:yes gene_type:complete
MLIPLRINQHASWKRDFPAYEAEFLEIFGTVTPTISDVSKWKIDWEENTSYTMELGDNSRQARAVAAKIGIHPYYWDICWSNNHHHESDKLGLNTCIQFYSEELLVMFKLTWANE